MIQGETSDIVLPKIWLVFALSDSSSASLFLCKVVRDGLSKLERCYLDASMLHITANPLYLYRICAAACDDDPYAVHSAIDLLAIVANHRKVILAEILYDLIELNAENAGKAKEVLDPFIN